MKLNLSQIVVKGCGLSLPINVFLTKIVSYNIQEFRKMYRLFDYNDTILDFFKFSCNS